MSITTSFVNTQSILYAAEFDQRHSCGNCDQCILQISAVIINSTEHEHCEVLIVVKVSGVGRVGANRN